MGKIVKLSNIEFYIESSRKVPNVYWDLAEETVKNTYGKDWRIPTLEELEYIKSLSNQLDIFPDFNKEDDYWTSTPGEPDYIPADHNEFGGDLRWFYQVRIPEDKNYYYQKGFLCHVDYYGNILPVRDI